MSKPMTDEQYLQGLRVLLREAVKKTQRLDALWNEINDSLNVKFAREGITDIVKLNQLKSASIPLADALNGGNWWRAKAVYLATVIQAELAMKEHEL